MADDHKQNQNQNPVVIPSPDYSFTRVDMGHNLSNTPKHGPEHEIPNISCNIEIPIMWIKVLSKDDEALSYKGDTSLVFDNPTYSMTTSQHEKGIWDSAVTPGFFKDYQDRQDKLADNLKYTSPRRRNIICSLAITFVALLFIIGIGIGLYFIVSEHTNSSFSEEIPYVDHGSYQVAFGLQGRQWSDDLGNPESDYFKALAHEVEDELDKAFFRSDLAQQFNRTEVVSFQNDDMITVKWIVHLSYPLIISEESLKKSVHIGFNKVKESGETSGSLQIDAKNSELSIILGSVNSNISGAFLPLADRNNGEATLADKLATPSTGNAASPSLNIATLSCQFEAGNNCNYTSKGLKHFTWATISPGQRHPSPASDPKGSTSGSYMYAGGSHEGDPGDVTYLQSEIYSRTPSGSMTFAYVITGGAILEVGNVLDTSSSLQLVQDTPYWTQACLNLSGSLFTQLLFKATRGSSFDSYVALDDIVLTAEECNRMIEPVASYLTPEILGPYEAQSILQGICTHTDFNDENVSERCLTLELISQQKTQLENCGYLLTGLNCAHAMILSENVINCTLKDWHSYMTEHKTVIQELYNFDPTLCVDAPLVQEIGGTVCASSGRLLTNGADLQDISSLCRIYVDFLGCLITVISYYDLPYTVSEVIKMTEVTEAVHAELFGNLNTTLCREDDTFSLPLITSVTSSNHCDNRDIIRYVITYDCQHTLHSFLQENDIRDKCSELQSISFCVSHALSSIFHSHCTREEVHAVIMKFHTNIVPTVPAKDIQQCESMLPCDLTELSPTTRSHCFLLIDRVDDLSSMDQSNVCRIFSHSVSCVMKKIQEYPHLHCSTKELGRKIKNVFPLSLSGCEVAGNLSDLCSDTEIVVDVEARHTCGLASLINNDNISCGSLIFVLNCLSWLEVECNKGELLETFFSILQSSSNSTECSADGGRDGSCNENTEVYKELHGCLSFLDIHRFHFNDSDLCRMFSHVLFCVKKAVKNVGFNCSVHETREISMILPGLSDIPVLPTCQVDVKPMGLCSDTKSSQIVTRQLCNVGGSPNCRNMKYTLECTSLMAETVDSDCDVELLINTVYGLLESSYPSITDCPSVVHENCTNVDFILKNEDYCADEKANIVEETLIPAKCSLLKNITSCLQEALYDGFIVLCPIQLIEAALLTNPDRVTNYLEGLDTRVCLQ